MTARELQSILDAAPEELRDASVYVESDGRFRIARAVVFALPRDDADGPARISLVTGWIVKHPDPHHDELNEPHTTGPDDGPDQEK